MRCQNCKIVIDAKFVYAIQKNSCPGCGKQIMDAKDLAVYGSLKSLLSSVCDEAQSDKIASLVTANFELKQTFKGVEPEKKEQEETMQVKEENEEEDNDDPVALDKEDMKVQMKESKKILQKMRDEALNGALQERYGLGDSGILIGDEQEKESHRDVILSGSGGENSFRRSS